MATYIADKDRALLREVLFEALPDIFHNESIRTRALAHPRIYNIPYLVEIALDRIGDLEFVDEEGYDFKKDKSDSKTTSMTHAINSNGYEICTADIKGKNKMGPLRVCLFNQYLPIGEQIKFFFIPRHAYPGDFKISWTEEGNHYNKYHKYLVESFEILAKCVA